MRGVNLIPASIRASRIRRDRFRGWLTGGAIYTCALLGCWAAAHMLWPDRHRAAAAELCHIQQQSLEVKSALAELRPRLQKAMTTLAASRSVGEKPDWSLLLTVLSDLLGDDTVLSSCALTVGGPGAKSSAAPTTASAPPRHLVTLTGLGRSQGAVLAYVRKLEATGLFQSVNLIDTRQEPFAAGAQAIAFRIECSMLETRESRP